MSNLSLKKFRKLSEREKQERYKELSDHDKFLVRISMNPGIEVIGNEKVTEEEKKWSDELIKQIIKNRK